MRRLAFILTIILILTLIILLTIQKPISITHQNNLTSFKQNQKIQTQGTVTQQTLTTLTLNNEITLNCNNCPNYLNQNITATATLQTYTKNPTLEVLKINSHK
jgi:hypothetical protein